MGLVTAQDYIQRAFRKCGQMRAGYTPSPEMLNEGMDEWNVLFDSWNADRTMNYTEPDFVFPVTGEGHGSMGNSQTWGGTGYDIGPTATDFVCIRPTKISRINLLLTDTAPAFPTRIPLFQLDSLEDWGSITTIQLTPGTVTTTFYYDPQYPNGVIWLWPPLNGNSLEIFTWGVLTPPATIDEIWSAPPGYSDAIILSLAEKLWPLCTAEFMPRKLSLQYISGNAYAARQRVKRLNAKHPHAINDFSVGGDDIDTLRLIQSGEPY